MARDGERQRTYDAEDRAHLGTSVRAPLPLDRLRELAQAVTETHLWSIEAGGRAVTVVRARANSHSSSANTDTATVRLGPDGHDLGTLAHELAHIAAAPGDLGHGPRFRALDAAIVGLLAGGAAATALERGFRDAGLEVDDLADYDDRVGAAGLADNGRLVDGDTRFAWALKIRKILDRANGTDSEGEATACLAKAAELMARHQVDAEMLAGLDGDRGADVIERRLYFGTGPYVRARLQLLSALGTGHGCSVFWSTGRTYNTAYVVGSPADVHMVLVTHTLLAAHAAAALLAARPRGNTLAWRRTFLFGYAQTVAEQFERAADHMAATAPDERMAIVRRERRRQVDTYVREHHGPIASVQSSRLRYADARVAGARAAASGDIGRGRLPLRRALTA